MTILLTGGARSGKSRMALRLAEQQHPKVLVATCQPLDPEMELRVRKHREERGADWITVEEPLEIASALHQHPAGAVVIDCLTLWLSNLMLRNLSDGAIHCYFERLVEALCARTERTILVTNEVGFGIVPDNELARRFRDLAGILNQKIATTADTVILCVSGLPLYLKENNK